MVSFAQNESCEQIDTLFRTEQHHKVIVLCTELIDKGVDCRDNTGAQLFLMRGVSKASLGDNLGAIHDLDTYIESTKGIESERFIKWYLQTAYESRGLSCLKIGNKEQGCLRLSKCGEYGDRRAYDLISKFCN